MTRRSAEIEATLSELEQHGAQVTNITTGGKHKRVYYHFEGRERFMVVAGTGSDHRGPENARQAVRRSLGIKRGKVVGPRRERPAKALERPADMPAHLTARRDPWATLQGTAIGKAAAAVAADRAWARFFGLHLINAGHIPRHPTIRAAVGLA